MKEMLEIVRKVMDLENLQGDSIIKRNPEKLSYLYGQIRVLKYIIDSSLIPDDRKAELKRMYEDSLQEYFRETGDNDITKILKIELEGASDILAWVMDVPRLVHVQNKKTGKMML